MALPRVIVVVSVVEFGRLLSQLSQQAFALRRRTLGLLGQGLDRAAGSRRSAKAQVK